MYELLQPTLLTFDAYGYGRIMSARCHAHGVDSPAACASDDFSSAEREAAIRVLRCGSHATESPFECHDMALIQAHGDAPHRTDDLQHLIYPRLG
jgi:hypothetical protein